MLVLRFTDYEIREDKHKAKEIWIEYYEYDAPLEHNPKSINGGWINIFGLINRLDEMVNLRISCNKCKDGMFVFNYSEDEMYWLFSCVSCLNSIKITHDRILLYFEQKFESENKDIGCDVCLYTLCTPTTYICTDCSYDSHFKRRLKEVFEKMCETALKIGGTVEMIK